MMNELRCWIFVISDETGNSQFHSTGISVWENFLTEDRCTGNSQSLQSGAIIFASERRYPECPGGTP